MEGFTPFSAEHAIALATVGAASLALPFLVRRAGERRLETSVAAGLAVILVGSRLLALWLGVGLYDRPLAEALPLHLCGVSVFLTAVMLLRRSFALFEINYFWGLAGGMQALATPNIHVSFPHPLFLTFFTTHGLLVLSVVYALVVFRFRPGARSLAKAVVATLAYLLLMIPVNIVLGTNFLYLRHKPTQPSLLDLMGPWPLYIPVLIGVGAVVCLLYYSPFALIDFVARRRQPDR